MKVMFFLDVDDISMLMKNASLQLSCSSEAMEALETAFREKDIPYIRRFRTIYPFQKDPLGWYKNANGHSLDELHNVGDTLTSIGFDRVCELWVENGKSFSGLVAAAVKISVAQHAEDSAPGMGK